MQLHQNKLFNGTQFTENILGELNLNYSTFREGRTIYRENDPTKNIFLILEGEVNIITHEVLEGSRPNSKVLSDGDFFGYDEHYYSVTRYSRAIALRDTEIVMVSMDELNNLIVKEWIIIDNLKNNIHFQLPVKKLKKSLKPEIIRANSAEIIPNISENDINRIQSEIVKAKLNAEKEIENRFSELHKKETELLKLKENLHKEKLFAEQTLQEELLELEKKEQALLLNEKSIEQVKATAEITLKNELRKLKEKEESLQRKAEIIEKDKLNLNDSIEKAKELALKEIELIKKSNQISSQAMYVDEILNKEKELILKENEINERFKKFEEKEEIVLASEKLKVELEEKEKELDNKFKEIEEKKAAIEKALKKEEALYEKESELEDFEQKLVNREKSFEEEKKQIVDYYESKIKFLEEAQENVGNLNSREVVLSNLEEELNEKAKILEQEKEDLEIQKQQNELLSFKLEEDIKLSISKEQRLLQFEKQLIENENQLELRKKGFEEKVLQNESKLKDYESLLSNFNKIKSDFEYEKLEFASKIAQFEKEKSDIERRLTTSEVKQASEIDENLFNEKLEIYKSDWAIKENELKNDLLKIESELNDKVLELKEKDLALEIALRKEAELKEFEQLLEQRAEELSRKESVSADTLRMQMNIIEKKEQQLLKRESEIEKDRILAEKRLLQETEALEQHEKELDKERQEFLKSITQLTKAKAQEHRELELERERTHEREVLEANKIIERNYENSYKAQFEAPVKQHIETPPAQTYVLKEETSPRLPATLNIQRDRTKPFQHFKFEFISIVIVNLSRCTSDKAVNFKTFLNEVFESNSKKIILDVSYSEFLDSTFLGVMVAFLKQLRRNDREMKVIVELSKMTTTTFILSGLDRVFTLEEDLNAAFYSFYNG